MKTVGLTGSIGAGKSTIAGLFEKLGAEVVSGDELGRQAVDRPELLAKIRGRFGSEVFDQEGMLNRKRLGELVFADPENVRWLTAETFPYIHREWLRAVDEAKGPVIIFDASLIFEWGIQDEFDLVVVVTASRKSVAERAASGRFTADELERRSNAQLPIEIKIVGADIVIHNFGTLHDLERHVLALWRSWTS